METQQFEIQPRNQYVIVKAVSKISPLLLTGVDPTANDMKEEVSFEIVAIGTRVENLNIGDKVYCNSNPDMLLNVKSNERSKKALIIAYKDVIKDNKAWQEVMKQGKIEVVEYLLYPEYNIVAVIK